MITEVPRPPRRDRTPLAVDLEILDLGDGRVAGKLLLDDDDFRRQTAEELQVEWRPRAAGDPRRDEQVALGREGGGKRPQRHELGDFEPAELRLDLGQLGDGPRLTEEVLIEPGLDGRGLVFVLRGEQAVVGHLLGVELFVGRAIHQPAGRPQRRGEQQQEVNDQRQPDRPHSAPVPGSSSPRSM
jgi:hypothetical protein